MFTIYIEDGRVAIYIYLSIFISIYLSIYLSYYLSIYISIYLSIYLGMIMSSPLYLSVPIRIKFGNVPQHILGKLFNLVNKKKPFFNLPFTNLRFPRSSCLSSYQTTVCLSNLSIYLYKVLPNVYLPIHLPRLLPLSIYLHSHIPFYLPT